ncbi:hypothetical protein [Dysgonomonas termitidis]|uniref:GH18 domain-containing protein n=1 Tax=Dysgonomonas termitidis TaxID=1516126 RepID=A0ABV9KTI5_9BACT
MARTIQQIKKEMTDAWISDPAIRDKYELDATKTFEEQFSVVSIESILFFVVAASTWTLETLFDIHRREVEDTLSAQKPHRLKWYRNKTLAFQDGYLLPEDSDIYPVIDEAAKVVKYAAAVEPPDSSKILIKIAGGDALRDKLPDATAAQVKEYIDWIKDAGVRIDLVNLSPDAYRCEVDIYYNAMLLADRVRDAVRVAIVGYIENLPFNGEYSNMALVDTLQGVEGVVIPELKAAYSHPGGGAFAFDIINAKLTPVAGYLRAYNESDIVINMIAYDS